MIYGKFLRQGIFFEGLGSLGVSLGPVVQGSSNAASACLKGEMTLKSRGPIPLYYDPLKGI